MTNLFTIWLLGAIYTFGLVGGVNTAGLLRAEPYSTSDLVTISIVWPLVLGTLHSDYVIFHIEQGVIHK